MNYADMTIGELRELIQEYQNQVDEIRNQMGGIAQIISEKLSIAEFERKIGSLGDVEKEYLRKMLSQSTEPSTISSSQDTQL